MPPLIARAARGLTVVELLVVIAIVGIFAAILYPSLTRRIPLRIRNVEGLNLRSIGQAALTYAAANGGHLPDPLSASGQEISGGSNYFRWIALLAKSGYYRNGASIYFSRLDAIPSGDIPAAILNPENANQLDPLFVTKIPAVEFVGGTLDRDSKDTPVCYTRGLKPDGTWDEAKGVYGPDGGGFIFFMGGNLVSYRGSTDHKLVQINGRPTSNLLQCVAATPGGNQRFYGLLNLMGTPDGAILSPSP